MLESFKAVIEELGGPAKFAREVGMGVGAAKQAARRDSLAPQWFLATASAARRKSMHHINEMTLLELAERRGRQGAKDAQEHAA